MNVQPCDEEGPPAVVVRLLPDWARYWPLPAAIRYAAPGLTGGVGRLPGAVSTVVLTHSVPLVGVQLYMQ